MANYVLDPNQRHVTLSVGTDIGNIFYDAAMLMHSFQLAGVKPNQDVYHAIRILCSALESAIDDYHADAQREAAAKYERVESERRPAMSAEEWDRSQIALNDHNSPEGKMNARIECEREAARLESEMYR